MYGIDGALGDHQPFVRLRSEGYGVVSFVCLGPNLLLVRYTDSFRSLAWLFILCEICTFVPITAVCSRTFQSAAPTVISDRTRGYSYPLGDIPLWLMNREDITVYAGTVRQGRAAS